MDQILSPDRVIPAAPTKITSQQLLDELVDEGYAGTVVQTLIEVLVAAGSITHRPGPDEDTLWLAPAEVALIRALVDHQQRPAAAAAQAPSSDIDERTAAAFKAGRTSAFAQVRAAATARERLFPRPVHLHGQVSRAAALAAGLHRLSNACKPWCSWSAMSDADHGPRCESSAAARVMGSGAKGRAHSVYVGLAAARLHGWYPDTTWNASTTPLVDVTVETAKHTYSTYLTAGDARRLIAALTVAVDEADGLASGMSEIRRRQARASADQRTANRRATETAPA